MVSPPGPHRSLSEPPPPPITLEDVTTSAAPQTIHARSDDRLGGPPLDPTGVLEEHELEPDEQHHSWRHTRRNFSTWKRKNPGPEWKEEWTRGKWKNGRVLLIDYISRELLQSGHRKVWAQEFHDVDGLRKFYNNDQLAHQAAFRVIHVQNAPWATRYLLKKFNIDHRDDVVGTAFGKWARYEKPQRRAGRPVPNGKAFQSQEDPWRRISRTSFGLDYLRAFPAGRFPNPEETMKMMELNKYDDSDNSIYGYDVFVQRMSVYVQKKWSESRPMVTPDMRNPYEAEYQEYYRDRQRNSSLPNGDPPEEYFPQLETLDNGNTVIVFEYSQSGDVNDTLIEARNDIENRWRRLNFYLSSEEAQNDERLAMECMKAVLRDIFKGLSISWELFIHACEVHVGILEDKIYESPADESRAPELWTNSNHWLKTERLLYIHLERVKEMKSYLRDLEDDDEDEDPEEWLPSTLDDFEHLVNLLSEDLVKPTANLSDLMYKSVEIRDSRYSLQLGRSMWRLSWITFIFLPGTFLVGFFGMNVDTFKDDPSIKWYFISAVSLVVTTFLMLYVLKHALARHYQTPLLRGAYENFYHELSDQHPHLWSRQGPRDIRPHGLLSSLKWRLLKRWFAPEYTLVESSTEHGLDQLGVWSRVKQYLVRRWLEEIHTGSESALMAELGVNQSYQEDGALTELVHFAQPVAAADGQPSVARLPTPPFSSGRPPRQQHVGLERPESRGSSGGVMVEEQTSSENIDREEQSRSERPPPERTPVSRNTLSPHIVM